MSRIDSVRIGDFEETAALELPLHWRNVLKDREDRFQVLTQMELTAKEIASSPTAMDVVFRLDQED